MRVEPLTVSFIVLITVACIYMIPKTDDIMVLTIKKEIAIKQSPY